MKELTPIQEAWLQALESGKYTQGTGRLHVGDKFCCLGILCEVAIEHKVPIRVRKSNNSYVGFVYTYNTGTTFIPTEVCSLVGLKDEMQTELSTKNDNGWNFKSIAKEIREHPDLYFI